MRLATRVALAGTLWLQLAAAQIAPAVPANFGDIPEESTAFSTSLSKPGESQAERQPSGVISITGEAVRRWTDCLGNSIKGKLLGLHGATIFLVVEDRLLTCPLAGFSRDDRQYVRSVLKRAGAESLFPGTARLDDEASPRRLTSREWHKQLDDWATAIKSGESGDRQAAEEAWHQLRAVRDHATIEHLETLIKRERNITVRTACVEAIASMGGPEVTRLLVELAVTDRSGPVRAAATWAMCHSEEVQTALVQYAQFIRADRFRDSALMSLQASGLVRPLSSSETPNTDLTTALIESLMIKRSRYVPYYVWSGYDTGWTPTGGGGIYRLFYGRAHGGGVRIDMRLPCKMAHDLLTKYTGEDYGYDQRSWREWQDTRPTIIGSQPDVPGRRD
jgi:hypothetical protein